MNTTKTIEHRTKYVGILEQDASKCLSALGLLESMTTEREKLSVDGKDPRAPLYNQIMGNAQDAAMLSLSRLFDTSKDAVWEWMRMLWMKMVLENEYVIAYIYAHESNNLYRLPPQPVSHD